jgi:hypothetical protein
VSARGSVAAAASGKLRDGGRSCCDASAGPCRDAPATATPRSEQPTATSCTHCDGAPMVLGCSAPEHHDRHRTSTRTLLRRSPSRNSGRCRCCTPWTSQITKQHPDTNRRETVGANCLLRTVKSICRVRTTDQKVRGSSPFGRARDQGRDQRKRGSWPPMSQNQPQLPKNWDHGAPLVLGCFGTVRAGRR